MRPDRRRGDGKGAGVPSRERARATDAMSAALAAAQKKADLHRVTTEERLFHSEYNVPPGHAAAPNEVRWALRGYLPPKHLRIDGYNYGIPEETEAEKDKSVAPPPDEVQWAAEEQAPAGSELAAAAPASARSLKPNCVERVESTKILLSARFSAFVPSCVQCMPRP